MAGSRVDGSELVNVRTPLPEEDDEDVELAVGV